MCIITLKNEYTVSVNSFFTSEFMGELAFFPFWKTIAVKGAIVAHTGADEHTEKSVKCS